MRKYFGPPSELEVRVGFSKTNTVQKIALNWIAAKLVQKPRHIGVAIGNQK